MASKLFHTVVAFGITLGSMSAGCSSPEEDVGASEAAYVADAPSTPDADRFCEVAWPTTKGGPRPTQAQACIDPKGACGAYPGPVFGAVRCLPTNDAGQCDFASERTFWMYCRTDGSEPTWVCPSGTQRGDACTAEEPTP